MPLHTRLDAVLAAGLARPTYRGRASLPTGMQPESMEAAGGAEAQAFSRRGRVAHCAQVFYRVLCTATSFKSDHSANRRVCTARTAEYTLS